MRADSAYCSPSSMANRLLAARFLCREYPVLLRVFRPLPLPALLSPLHPAHRVVLELAKREPVVV